MTLLSGTRLGPYEIVAPLGAGGMGEVYRARDSRLGRDVAVKVLPTDLCASPDRLRRFELEARAAGALNHPNIVAVLDVGANDGSPYVVSELLEGETLRERMGSALPQRKALDLAIQMAHGLAAAHEKGIVHRDIKPENVFVTKDGRAKILDFGLAKLRAQTDSDAGSAVATATHSDETGSGIVLGTVGYMSPEQVRGEPADHRSDIFSFGSVLYEMLARRRAFRRDTAAETMTAILREDPPALSETDPSLPPAIDRIVRRCLEKKPDERFQSARDLAFAIDALSAASGVGIPAPSKPRASHGRYLLVGAGLLLLGAFSFVAGVRTRPRAFLPRYDDLTSRQGVVWSARFAPDGETVVYSAEWPGRPMELFSTWGTKAASRPIGLTDAKILAISRQGELAVALRPRLTSIFMHRGTLARVPLAGGTPRELADDVQEADWSPDGQALAVIRWNEESCRLEYPLGTPLYTPAAPAWLSNLRFSPRGDALAFFEHSTTGSLRGTVNIMDLHGKRRLESKAFDDVLTGLSWTADSAALLFGGATDKATQGPWGIYRMTAAGQGQPLAYPGVAMDILDSDSRNRLLLRRTTFSTVTTGRFASGRDQDLSENDLAFIVDLSADGTTLLGTNQAIASTRLGSLFLKPTDKSASVRLGDGDALALSRDGKWALARLAGKDVESLVVMPTGAGQSRDLPRGELDHYFEADWFPDDERVLFSAAAKGGERRLYIQDVSGGSPRAVGPEGYSLPSIGSSISPDGLKVAALGPDLGAVLLAIDGGQGQPIPGLEAGDVPIGWSADGRGLYFFNATDDEGARVQHVDLATGRRRLVRELLPSRPAGMIGDFRILVSANGDAFVHSYSRLRCDLVLMSGLQ